MRRFHIGLYFTLIAGLVLAQQPLTNDSVLKLVKADMGDDVIVNMIDTQPSSFSLGPDELIVLKTGGVSQKVLSAMLLKNARPAPVTTSCGPSRRSHSRSRRVLQEGWRMD